MKEEEIWYILLLLVPMLLSYLHVCGIHPVCFMLGLKHFYLLLSCILSPSEAICNEEFHIPKQT